MIEICITIKDKVEFFTVEQFMELKKDIDDMYEKMQHKPDSTRIRLITKKINDVIEW